MLNTADSGCWKSNSSVVALFCWRPSLISALRPQKVRLQMHSVWGGEMVTLLQAEIPYIDIYIYIDDMAKHIAYNYV